MPKPPLTALRAFEAVARLGSFGAAAKALFVSQSAVSHQVRHLEDWLGRPLFDRRGPRPRLLPHGRDLARDLTLALGGIEAACDRARAQSESQALVIAAIPSVAVCWLIPRLPAFRAAYPDIPVRIVYSFFGHEIDVSTVHLAFVYAPTVPALTGMRTERFLSGASVPVCSPALIDRYGGTIPPGRGFLDVGLLHDTDTSGWSAWFSRSGSTSPPTFEGPVFEDFNLLRAAALSGQGVALCPTAMIESDLAQGHLVRLSDVTVLEGFGYYLLSHDPEHDLTPSMAATFRNWAFAARDGTEFPGTILA
ncbi:LysR family transcriptional regulator [Jannaschia rubra]|uniref:LysR family transcriptional regulator n=1 Tax=Jannaschia rubra TaxID=282197 RepID=UPI0024912730|nr:LysR family transcriptional regulator [Jannaschia rubra]